jgi:hypothetical protein
MGWARFPSVWVQDGGLQRLTWRAHRGGGVGALLVYLFLLIAHNRAPLDKLSKTQEGVLLTYDLIEQQTNLSRALVARSLKILVDELRVIEVARSQLGNRYRVVGIEEIRHARIPQDLLYSPARGLFAFRAFSFRSKHELNALKLYLLLLAFRVNRTSSARIGYEKISYHLGVQRDAIRPAISHLINLGLIAVENEETLSPGKSGHPFNQYQLKGVFS